MGRVKSLNLSEILSVEVVVVEVVDVMVMVYFPLARN